MFSYLRKNRPYILVKTEDKDSNEDVAANEESDDDATVLDKPLDTINDLEPTQIVENGKIIKKIIRGYIGHYHINYIRLIR